MKNLDKAYCMKLIVMVSIALFLAVNILMPVAMLFKKAFFNEDGFILFDNFKQYLKTPTLKVAITNSFFVAIMATIIVLILAFIFAYALEYTNIRFKRVIELIAILPLFAPTMTHGIALIYLFGNKGLFTTGFFGKLPFLQFQFPLYGKWGIICGEAIYMFPVIFLMLSVGFKLIDNRLYEAAEMLCASKFKKFTSVTLPGMKYTVLSALFGGFTMAFTDFGVPKVLGGNYNVLATDIFNQVIGQQNMSMGSVVGILLVVPAVIAFIAEDIINNKKVNEDFQGVKYKIEKSKYRDLGFTIIVWIVNLIILIIFTVLIMGAFINQWPYDLSFTLKWFNCETFGASTLSLYLKTVVVALISATLGTSIAFLASYCSNRGKGNEVIKRVIAFLSKFTLALPGLVIGLSFILFFNAKENPLNILYGTIFILIIANIIHFLAVPYMTISSSMNKINREYESVSESLGVPWYKLLFKVILPLSKYAILDSFAYYFVNSMMTVAAAVFLYTTETKLIAIEMVSRYDMGDFASSAALAVMIIGTNMILDPKGLSSKFFNRKERYQ